MLKILAAAALGAATLAGASALAGGTSSVGVPNPASVLCADLDGNPLTLNFPEGQLGVCNLGGGLVEEWTLLKGPAVHQKLARILRRQG